MMENGKVFFPTQETYHELIDYYEGECLLDRALEVADTALLQHSSSVIFLLRKAELLLERKEPENTLAILDQVEALLPGCLKGLTLRAEAYAMLGMHSDAFALLDDAKNIAEGNNLSDIYMCEALICDSTKEYERMFFLLKAALKENPENAEALSRMWYCVESAMKHEESIELHECILNDYPFNALAWYNLGAARQYQCLYPEAIEAYEFAFLTREDFEFAYRDCAEVCLLVQDYHKALQCYQEVLERFEPDTDLFLHIGICYLKLGNYPVARNFCERAVDFDPYNAEAHFHIGECFAYQHEWHKAVAAYLRAIRIEERNEDYFVALGEAYVKTGNLKKADFFFRAACDTAPEDARFWLRRAQFLMENNKLQQALEVLDEADENSFGAELLYCRSVCLFGAGQKQEALLVLEEALYEDYDAHDALFRLMPILENDREVKAVISIFQPE